LNNGLLPVQVSPEFLEEIFSTIEKDSKSIFTVNLENQTFTNNSTGKSNEFEITDYKKICLLNGYDDIDYLVAMKEEIEEFEKK
jgi:3-isopropylmalate/(R)-2-methylmalate dehydratase small subunit